MPSDAYTERILNFVQAKGYQPQAIADLALAMGIGAGEQGDFHDACKALMKTGRIILGSRQAVMLPEPGSTMIGTYRGNRRGFGFVIPETPNAHGDLYVPEGASGGAITGDTVVARVLKRGKRKGRMLYEGRIVEVVKRGQSRFVGELCRQANRWYVIPDGNTLHVPIHVGDPGVKGGQIGDQVVVEIVQYPTSGTEARGVIVKALGVRGEPGVDALSIIEQFQLPGDFPDVVLDQARDVIASYKPRAHAKSREDLRNLTTITIDPTDAKDFDDAISVTKLDGAKMELGVHIADVAHFVEQGSALDLEAADRANSIYLPGTVIPMLPEVLSNGICSLQEGQPRLTKSVFIIYDRTGKVVASRLANTIIRSAKRLTYEKASAILDGKPGRMKADVVAVLENMNTLAKRIERRRQREGMLTLDLPEVELVFDTDRRVVDVEPADTSYSHKIIEMFMVEANEAVARTLHACQVPVLRRIHDEPDEGSEESLRRFLGILGHELPQQLDRHVLQKLIKKVRGKGESFAVNLAILRSLQQAEYMPTPIGHYALASTHYAHFTSPIRRYPDLTVHRLVDQYLEGVFDTPKGRAQAPSVADLTTLGKHCSTNERRAESAERELRLVHILRLLEDQVGDVFDGIVTGIANVGLFVQLQRFLVDGLLRYDGLPEDWWEVDADHGVVVGERTGKVIKLGDRLKVKVARISLPTRQIELALAQTIQRTDRTYAKTIKKKKTRKSTRKATSKGTVRNRKPKTGRKRRTESLLDSGG